MRRASSQHLLKEHVTILHPVITTDGMGGHTESFVPEATIRRARFQALKGETEAFFAGTIEADGMTQVWVEPYPIPVESDDRVLDDEDKQWEIVSIMNIEGLQRLTCKDIGREP